MIETAKAYGWSANMVSGAFGKLERVLHDIKTIRPSERVKSHQFMPDGSMSFLGSDYYKDYFWPEIELERLKASYAGFNGYDFFDVFFF